MAKLFSVLPGKCAPQWRSSLARKPIIRKCFASAHTDSAHGRCCHRCTPGDFGNRHGRGSAEWLIMFMFLSFLSFYYFHPGQIPLSRKRPNKVHPSTQDSGNTSIRSIIRKTINTPAQGTGGFDIGLPLMSNMAD